MSETLTCMALASVLAPAAPDWGPVLPERQAPTCLEARIEGAGRLGAQGPDILPSPYLELSRARAALGVGQGVLGARMAFVGVRSAPDQGYVGIDGEAWVPTVQLAEARLRLDSVGFAGAMGLVDDLWVASGNTAWGLRAVAPTLGEQQGWFSRSDLGGLASWTSSGGYVTLSGTATSGEGSSRRDRNDGIDSTGLLTVRPLAFMDDGPRVQAQLMLRDGSFGQSYIRDHRQGVRLRAAYGPGVVGGSWVSAQGVAGDGAREPSGMSIWASVEPEELPLLGFLRYDRLSEDAGNSDAVGSGSWVGAGLRLPAGRSSRPAGRLLAVYHSESRGSDAAPLAGAASLTELNQFFLQLDVDVRSTHWGSEP